MNKVTFIFRAPVLSPNIGTCSLWVVTTLRERPITGIFGLQSINVYWGRASSSHIASFCYFFTMTSTTLAAFASHQSSSEIKVLILYVFRQSIDGSKFKYLQLYNLNNNETLSTGLFHGALTRTHSFFYSVLCNQVRLNHPLQ